MENYLLGIDIGLTVSKVMICDFCGNEIVTVKKNTPIYNNSFISEIDMTRLWEDASSLILDALEKSRINPIQIAAVGTCGHGNGLYLLDKNEEPFNNAITSMDHRALSIIKRYKVEDKENLRKLSLQETWDGQPGPILKWFKEKNPTIYDKIGHVLFCKDWINYCLTDSIRTDYSDISASGLLNNLSKNYDRKIFNILDIDEMYYKMPAIIKSYDITGYVSKAASYKTNLIVGTPVIGGVFDVDACGYGAGLIDSNEFCIVAGTWNINMIQTKNPVLSKKIRQCIIRGDGNQYLAIDSSPTSASNLEWFMKNIMNDKYNYDDFQNILSRYKPDDLNLIYMPFIYGSVNDKNPGGMFYNLRSSNTSTDLLRSIAEGICFAHKYHIDNLKDLDLNGQFIRMTGGASNNSEWCKIFADSAGMNVNTFQSKQTGALGACIMAGIGVHIFENINEGVNRMVHSNSTFGFDKNNYIKYQKKYDVFKRLINDFIE